MSAATPSSPNSLSEAERSVSLRPPQASRLIKGAAGDRLIKGDAAGISPVSLIAAPIRLLGFRKDIPALMSACDIFVLPAPAEPFGLVLLEAMAMGKPVIATNVGGPREIVEQGVTGLLVPPGDPSAMAAAITQLLANPDQARAMGIAGRRRFEEHFTATRMAQQIATVYGAS